MSLMLWSMDDISQLSLFVSALKVGPYVGVGVCVMCCSICPPAFALFGI